MKHDNTSLSSGVLAILLKVGFSLILCVFILSKIDRQEWVGVISRLSFFSMLVAVFLIAVSLLFAGFRWRILLKSQGHVLSYGFLCRVIFIGFFFNQGLPSSIGGDIYRISALGRQIDSLTHAFMSVLLERLYGLLVFSLAALAAFLVEFPRFGQSSLWQACLLTFAGISFVLAFLIVLRFLPLRWRERMLSMPYLYFLRRFMDALSQTDLRFSYVSQAFLWTFLSHGMFIATFVWLGKALALPFSWMEALAVVPITTIISSLPISFAGWGVREGIFVYALSYFAMSAEAALSLSVLYGVAQWFVAGVGLGLWLVGKRYGNRISKAAKA